MSYTVADLRAILAGSRLKTVKNLLDAQPQPFGKGDLVKIEGELLTRAPEDTNLVELFDFVRERAAQAGTPEKFLKQMRLPVEYPLPKNPYHGGFQEAEQICADASRWLQANQQTTISNPPPALAFLKFLVSAILEFRVLHTDYIPAILRSLHEKREFPIHTNTVWALPLSLNYGRQKNAECRLLILRQQSVKRLQEFLVTDNAEFLGEYVKFAGDPHARSKELLQALERAALNDLAATHVADSNCPSVSSLIERAQILAILELPSVVVAHRSRQFVSHSLPPEVLSRIGGWDLKRFQRPKRKPAEDDPDVKIPPGSAEEPPWMQTLRAALAVNGIVNAQLDLLGPGTPKLMGEFAKYLAAPGRCAPLSVRRYCLLIATRVIPRLRDCPATEVTDDAWEDTLEQVLDEDAFFQQKRYTARPSSHAQTHSRPLVKALRHWLRFLRQEQMKQKNGNQNGNQEPAAHPDELARLERGLPVLGLVEVDASLITVDEYSKALNQIKGERGSDQALREAARVALILGYRCGLRRMECAGLRVCDFDGAGHLHVRPTKMRPLKTSNARRDLPLALLIPEAELKHVRRRAASARALARKTPRFLGYPPQEAYLFSEPDDLWKPTKNFDAIVKHIHLAFRGDVRRDWEPIDTAFHYHRLRHSFANMMLLKLWPNLQRVACHFLRAEEYETRKWIQDVTFRQQLFGTQRVTEGDLQGIAILLGHGAAATSLEHYLHVLDWYERPETWSE